MTMWAHVLPSVPWVTTRRPRRRHDTITSVTADTHKLHPDPEARRAAAGTKRVTHVRSTLLMSSQTTLRAEGLFERYWNLLAAEARDEIAQLGAPGWLPITVALRIIEPATPWVYPSCGWRAWRKGGCQPRRNVSGHRAEPGERSRRHPAHDGEPAPQNLATRVPGRRNLVRADRAQGAVFASGWLAMRRDSLLSLLTARTVLGSGKASRARGARTRGLKYCRGTRSAACMGLTGIAASQGPFQTRAHQSD